TSFRATAGHAACGWSLQRVIWPRMFRIAPPEFLTHLEVRRVPKAFQIGRHLYGLVSRRKEVDNERRLSSVDTRRLTQSEHLLQTHGEDRWCPVRSVLDPDTRAARYGEVARCKVFQRLLLLIGERVVNDVFDVQLLELLGLFHRSEVWSKPSFGMPEECGRGHVRPRRIRMPCPDA